MIDTRFQIIFYILEGILERIQKLIIRNEKVQYDINRKAAKISTSSPGKIDKYKNLSLLIILQKKLQKKKQKQLKTKKKKQIDAIMNQNKRQAVLINEDDKVHLTKKYLKNLLEQDLMKRYNRPMKQMLMIRYITSKVILLGKNLMILKIR